MLDARRLLPELEGAHFKSNLPLQEKPLWTMETPPIAQTSPKINEQEAHEHHK